MAVKPCEFKFNQCQQRFLPSAVPAMIAQKRRFHRAPFILDYLGKFESTQQAVIAVFPGTQGGQDQLIVLATKHKDPIRKRKLLEHELRQCALAKEFISPNVKGRNAIRTFYFQNIKEHNDKMPGVLTRLRYWWRNTTYKPMVTKK